jgi:hypothetical protein
MSRTRRAEIKVEARRLAGGRQYHIEWYTSPRYIPQAVVVIHGRGSDGACSDTYQILAVK